MASLREGYPEGVIVLGGPEISYDVESGLARAADCVICGDPAELRIRQWYCRSSEQRTQQRGTQHAETDSRAGRHHDECRVYTGQDQVIRDPADQADDSHHDRH